jgi:cell wall-associated NlpC family hydrolase
MITRDQVVKAARSYVGTPFSHQGRVCGKGVDCVGVVICVAVDLGIKDTNGVPFQLHDYPDYSSQPLGSFVHDEARTRLIEKSVADIKAGDVVTMKVPYTPSHAGIIAERDGVLYLIHALNTGKKPRVVEHIIDKVWRSHITGAFTYPGVEL